MLNLKVMVIDDDELMLDIVKTELTQLGLHAIECYQNGNDALLFLEHGDNYDIVFVDLQMPAIDGVEVLRHISEMSFSGSVVLMSGEDERILNTAELLVKEMGINLLSTFVKPLDKNKLDRLIETYQPNTLHIHQSEWSINHLTVKNLVDALLRGEIVPYFQPQVRVSDMSVVGAEVLARWEHPTQGIIFPGQFLPIAEENEFLDAITRVMLRQSFQCLGQWRKNGIHINLALNVSAACLTMIDLPEQVADLCALYTIPPHTITLEVTEGMALSNLKTSLAVLVRLRLQGVKLSIDDFGTGFSSYTQIKNVPFTELKIDRSFVHGSQHNSTAYAIMESSVELAKKLNMQVVAEGVEDKVDWDVAEAVGSDIVQGHYIAKAMANNDFIDWLENWEGKVL